MKVKCTYFQNDEKEPLKYGDMELINPPRERLRDEPKKEGILAESVIVGFCGTDNELMHMGSQNNLSHKFPEGTNRLINGHEGVVFVPSENRFAIVLIRGGNSYDPTRYMEDEDYFEYGCDRADGLFSDMNYYNPDMLLRIPNLTGDKIPLSLAKRLVFPDPYACMVFQLERMEDLGVAQMFRVYKAKYHVDDEEARRIAKEKLFERTVIFGLGTTGMFMGDLIKQNYPNANIVYVARSEEASPKVQFALQKSGAMYVQSKFDTNEQLADAICDRLGGKAGVFIGVSGTNVEHEIAFDYGVLGCNGIYNSFSLGPRVEYNTMPFGFQNQLIFASINFTQAHMEKAIQILCNSNYDEIVELIDKEEFIKDPMGAYQNKIFSKAAPLKTAVVWNERYVDFSK